ncbi:MAG: hydantoinase/oxoprolinase family protein [Betaproteobacteria bacterium]|nr:hydantoinase/oxoprolinase family protein [Betaproteobacteria bacterium]
MAHFRLGVDVGGTFTDFVAVDADTGQILREKCLTTPHDPVEGIMHGIEKLRVAKRLEAQDVRGVAHATTLVANLLIERKGAPAGLLVTEGFRDLLELGNDTRYDMYDLAIEFPTPLVPRPRRLGIRERVDAGGASLARPDAREVRRKVRQLVRDGVTSVAVCFLHSYRNPGHEQAVSALLEKEFPGLEVSLSSTVAPEIREYERTVTVVANAYVKPAVRSYLERLEGALRKNGIAAPILVMLSNGGMTTPGTAAEVPIRLVESGPAAGVLAACYSGQRIAEPNLLAFDMGGTTAKSCFIDGGRPAFTGTFEAARVKRQFHGSGFPLKLPSVAMIEIGAGGGSIARVDGTGLLKVGPESAGASPGPACYGLGGSNPTVTDADLALGYVDPEYFLGGEMQLHVNRANDAIARVARACGLAMTEAAAGIVRVVNQNMATAIRIHAAERGKDYRRYGLFAFGGAGPVHAYEIARILDLPKVICPLGAGTNSAFGLLAAPAAVDLSRSYNVPLDDINWPYLNQIFGRMEREARKILRDAGVAEPVFSRAAEMRFIGQGFELSVPIPGGKLGGASAPAIKEAFCREYRGVYHGLPGDLPVEAITWRLRASGPAPRLSAMAGASTKRGGRLSGRKVYFPEIKDFIETQVFDRYALGPGETISGPAVVEEQESTVVIGPSGRATVDPDLNLVIEVKRG